MSRNIIIAGREGGGEVYWEKSQGKTKQPGGAVISCVLKKVFDLNQYDGRYLWWCRDQCIDLCSSQFAAVQSSLVRLAFKH